MHPKITESKASMQGRSPVSSFYTVVRQTWLTRRPSREAEHIVLYTLAFVALGTSIYWRNLWGLSALMPASGYTVFQQHQFWRLWTAILAHGDLGHFLGNSLLFTVLGYFLAGYFGWRMFPVAAFALGGVANAISVALYPPQVELIGASGVVTWMGGAWLALYFLLNREKTLGQRAIRALGVALLLFAPAETLDPTVHISHQTHLIGFILGLLYGFYYFWRNHDRLRAAEVIERVVDAEPLDGDPFP